MDGYVFWGGRKDGKPMENSLFLEGLRGALQAAGMGREAAAGYTFHSWRHFFTTYMRERVNEKLLQSQTGHKTAAMLEHYSAHRMAGDRERIRRAQVEAFGGILTGVVEKEAVKICG
jgi:integrase